MEKSAIPLITLQTICWYNNSVDFIDIKLDLALLCCEMRSLITLNLRFKLNPTHTRHGLCKSVTVLSKEKKVNAA